MAKFHVLWEVDKANLPANPREKIGAILKLCAMMKEDMKSGLVSEWGSFSNQHGYSIMNGTDVEICSGMVKYSNLIKFGEPTLVVSIDQSIEIYEKLAKMVAVAPKQ